MNTIATQTHTRNQKQQIPNSYSYNHNTVSRAWATALQANPAFSTKAGKKIIRNWNSKNNEEENKTSQPMRHMKQNR